jgi:P pilus assembly chaperone PapD
MQSTLADLAQSKPLRMLYIGSLALAALTLNPLASKAQVSLSPLILETEANRGQAQAFITVTNDSDKPFRARVYAEPFTYDRDNGFQSLKSTPTDLTPYLQFSPRELLVQPGMNRRIRLITRFPPSQPTGEYRAVIFTENLSETQDAAGNKVSLATRIGATFYVRQGTLTPNLTVDSASWNTQQQKIQVLVKNAGQASARPSVNWTLKKGSTVIKTGEIQASGVVAQGDRNLLIGYPTKEDPALQPGEYQLTGELLWGKSMWGGNTKELKQVPFSFNLAIPAMNAPAPQKTPKISPLPKQK